MSRDGPLFTPIAPLLEASMERARQRRLKEAQEKKKVVPIGSRRRPVAEDGNEKKKDA